MLDDILEFAVLTLVDNGRLSFWMPTSNEQEQEIQVPTHCCLAVSSICTQTFNKCKDTCPQGGYPLIVLGSRRLITYRRLPDAEVPESVLHERKYQANGVSADELNPFRRMYFHGFRSS